jgi:ligand-binding sensor domain-containing protein/signal transduction histidine kinase
MMKPRERLLLLPALSIAVMLWVAGCAARGASLSSASSQPTTPPVGELAPGTLGDRDTPSATGVAETDLSPLAPAGPKDLRFERISVERGLSQSTVNCILQDRTGFMWFGTDDGLNRFDGYSFKVYRHDPQDPQTPSHNLIMSLHQDPEGVLWIGTYGGGLDRFDPQTGLWGHYQHDPDDPHSLSDNKVRSIYGDRSGILWIATHGGGLNRFDRETEQFTHYGPNPQDPFSLRDWLIDSVYEDRQGRLWIGSNNEGLIRFDRSTERFVHFQHDPDDLSTLSADIVLSAIVEDSIGMLWIVTFDGLNRFDPETGQALRYQHDPDDPHSLSHDVVNTIYQDSSDRLWVGTADGLNQYDPATGTFVRYQNDPGDPHSLSNNHIISIFQDRTGALWIGTRGGGLNRVDPWATRFQHYAHDPNNHNSLSDNNVEAILEDHAGVLWIGTSEGLNRFDRTTGRWSHFRHDPNDPDSLSNDIVGAILEDRSGVLWIGTAFGGLNRFDRASERFSRYPPGPSDSDHALTQSGIRALYQDAEGKLWIGTHGDGINVLDPETGQVGHFKHDPHDPNSLGNDWIYTLCEDREGVLWIGTRDAGLDRYDRETKQFSHYRHDPSDPQSLGGGIVHAIHQDRSGALWVGTEGGGLNRLDREENTFLRYGVKDGLPSNSVFAILEDDRGVLWLSTANGISRFDPQRGTFKNYDMRDGLQGTVFVGGASYRSDSGEMFFGGFDGFNAFYPERIQDNPYVPPIVLTSMTQGGRAVDLGVPVESVTEVTFRRPDSFFEFEFAALNYSQPGKNQYAYMLEGFDTGWNHLGTGRLGQYDNLPAGRYTLRVKGSNNDGVWNEQGLSIQVTVVPQVWETWWFQGLAILLVVGGATGAYRLRVRGIEARSRALEGQVEQRTAELSRTNLLLEQEIAERRRAEEALAQKAAEAAVVAERSRLARELHDAVTQTLFSASLIAETLPRSWERDREKGRRLLKELRQLSRGALAEMRTLLLELRPAALIEADLGDLLQQLAEAATGQGGLPVTVTVEGKCALPPDIHVALYRIAQEALNNAIKHAQARQVAVHLRCAARGGMVDEGTRTVDAAQVHSEDAQEGGVELSIRDNGRGFDPDRVPPERLGLSIMQERAQAIGATLMVQSQPGQGTEVRVAWIGEG